MHTNTFTDKPTDLSWCISYRSGSSQPCVHSQWASRNVSTLPLARAAPTNTVQPHRHTTLDESTQHFTIHTAASHCRLDYSNTTYQQKAPREFKLLRRHHLVNVNWIWWRWRVPYKKFLDSNWTRIRIMIQIPINLTDFSLYLFRMQWKFRHNLYSKPADRMPDTQT